MGKLLVGIVLQFELRKFLREARIHIRALALQGVEFVVHFANGLGDFLRLTEGNVEGDDFCAVVAQRVEHVSKMGA